MLVIVFLVMYKIDKLEFFKNKFEVVNFCLLKENLICKEKKTISNFQRFFYC